MVDGIVSENGTEFVEELKRRLNYELALAATLRSETHLKLSFEVKKMFSLIQ